MKQLISTFLLMLLAQGSPAVTSRDVKFKSKTFENSESKVESTFQSRFKSFSKVAQGQDRGGGNSLVCQDQSGKESSELLDFAEARTLKRNRILNFDKSLNYKNILSQVIERVRKVSPAFATDLEIEWENFDQEVLFLDESAFTTVNDSNHLSVPHNCVVVQTAIQKDVKFPSDKRFFVNQNIWQTLPALDQAGLVAHEIIYSLLRKGPYPIATSEGARYINSWIFSEEFQEVDKLKFATILLSGGFRSVKLDEVQFYPPSFESTGWLYRLGSEKYQPVKMKDVATLGAIQLDHKTGGLKAILKESALNLQGQKILVRFAEFHKSGEIRALAVLEESSKTVRSCWIRIGPNKSIQITEPLDATYLYDITSDPVFLSSESCQDEAKTEEFDKIKAILFSSLE